MFPGLRLRMGGGVEELGVASAAACLKGGFSGRGGGLEDDWEIGNGVLLLPSACEVRGTLVNICVREGTRSGMGVRKCDLE